MDIFKIGTPSDGANCYCIFVGVGEPFAQEFCVYANGEAEAINLVADFCAQYELRELYADHYDIADLCEGETVDEYAKAHNLTYFENQGVYINIVKVVKF